MSGSRHEVAGRVGPTGLRCTVGFVMVNDIFVLSNEDQLYCLWLAYCAYSGQAPTNVSGLMS
jgi:hypothetical protein